MIKLTDAFDNPIYVSPNHIEMMEVCYLKEDEKTSPLGVTIHLQSGKQIKVQECLRDINKLIEEYWNKI